MNLKIKKKLLAIEKLLLVTEPLDEIATVGKFRFNFCGSNNDNKFMIRAVELVETEYRYLDLLEYRFGKMYFHYDTSYTYKDVLEILKELEKELNDYIRNA